MSPESFVILLLTFAVLGFAFVAVCSLLAGVWWLIESWPKIDRELWPEDETEADSLDLTDITETPFEGRDLESNACCGSDCDTGSCACDSSSGSGESCCAEDKRCPYKVPGIAAFSLILAAAAIYVLASGSHKPAVKKLRKRFK